jgi:hypothetical protein
MKKNEKTGITGIESETTTMIESQKTIVNTVDKSSTGQVSDSVDIISNTKSKKKNPLSITKVIKIMKELEDKLEFSGFEFNMDGGLEGCVEGFEFVLERRIDVVLDKLEDLFDKTDGFKDMDPLEEAYDDLSSKTVEFRERVTDLRDSCNLKVRNEIVKDWVTEIFIKKVSIIKFPKEIIENNPYYTRITTLIETMDKLLVKIVSKLEFEDFDEEKLSDEVTQFIEDCETELYTIKRTIKDLSEELNETFTESENKSKDEILNEELYNILCDFQEFPDSIETLLESEESRCEEIEYEWGQVYREFTDSVIDEYDL